MIQSMTGYGKSVAEFQGKKIHAEIKSLNSKALDMTTRIAPIYREKEMELRQLIQTELERGKVEFSIWVEKSEATNAAPINVALATEYFRQMQALSEQLGLDASNERNTASDWMRALVRMPDVMLRTEVEELTDEEWVVARRVAEEAVQNLVEFRKQEGRALAKKFQEKIDNITALLSSIEPYEQGRTEKIRQRIVDTLEQQIGTDYDKNRLEQELIYYIEKLDISEEKQRLSNHLRYFVETMNEGKGQGKKLGFIAQEMGREINTTGSKSNQAEMQNIVVRMKDELEQIKEQVLNVM
ncbi:MAG: YicC family protein [Bacteroidaceae bacterium]|nr:YicC family protein [Bacteroidaceae bacterium]